MDGRRFNNTPFLIADIGGHDVILGKSWLAEQDIWLDVRHHRLVWPDECALPQSEEPLHHERVIPREILKRPVPKSEHQADEDRQEKCPSRYHSQYHVPRTYKQDIRDGMRKMRDSLSGKADEAAKREQAEQTERDQWKQMKQENQKVIQIDIAMVGDTGFKRTLGRAGTEGFTTSLYEIDRLIEDKREVEWREIQQTLPEQYHPWTDVFMKSELDTLPPRRDCDHQIKLHQNHDLGYCPLYKMSREELEAAKKYITENLHKGFIMPSNAPFASPILMAMKPGGGLRFCVDYRKLNAATVKDRYPLPLVSEMMDRISRGRIFTKLDIRQGFYRIRLSPESEDLTTFRTRYGTYKYRVMPFGLTNGPATFQRFMNDVLLDYLDEFVTVYVDDLLIFSENKLDHEIHVQKVLTRLREAGLQVALEKCEFSVKKTKFLGFIISSDGITVDPEKVKVIYDWKEPATVTGVQSFLGFCNFYRRFVKNYGRVARPLNQLTKKDVPFIFDAACKAAFRLLKQKLVEAPILRHYDPNRQTCVETDASDGVAAAVLSQEGDDGYWHPVAYYSKTLTPTEVNYEIHDKEMLAIVQALGEWRAELIGLREQSALTSELIIEHWNIL